MTDELRVLIVEDSADDALLMVKELERAGLPPSWKRVASREELTTALVEGPWDVVLGDHELPGFSGLDALAAVREHDPDLAFVAVSGRRDAEIAVRMIHAGADNYVRKDRLALLGPAVDRALKASVERRARREAEKRYRELFESVPIGIYQTTADGRILMANPALYRMLGFDSLESLMSRNLEESGFEPEYPRSKFKQFVEESGEVNGLESAWRRADGTLLWVREHAKVVRGRDGQILYYEGTVEDISERKRMEEGLRASEERYRRLFLEAPVGILHYDRNLVITDCNEIFVTRLRASREQLIGLDMREIEDSRLLPALEAPLEGERGYYEGPCGTPVGDEEIECVLNTVPVFDHSGRVVSCIGVVRDVTREKVLERQFLQAQKMESIGRLAGGVAHDLNNILQAMMGHLEVLVRRARGTSLESVAEAVQSDVDRAGRLTSQLLAYSRQTHLRRGPLELNEVLTNVVGMLRRLIPENIHFTFSPAASDLPILADRMQIEQVVMNLAVNAKDACESGGSIGIRTFRRNAEKSFRKKHPWADRAAYAAFEVSDDGPGIPESVRDRIFDPFFTTKEIGKGSGLGLSAVQGIVEQHGGGLGVDSKPGRGATFTVYLPLLVDEVDGVDPGSGHGLATNRGERGDLILVVEDDSGARALACRLLESAGYRTVEAADGEEALARYEALQEEIRMAVVDVVLPRVQGTEVARKLWETARLPVLLVSVSPLHEIRENLNGIEDLRFLHKPYSMEPLLEAVRSLLGSESPSHHPQSPKAGSAGVE